MPILRADAPIRTKLVPILRADAPIRVKLVPILRADAPIRVKLVPIFGDDARVRTRKTRGGAAGRGGGTEKIDIHLSIFEGVDEENGRALRLRDEGEKVMSTDRAGTVTFAQQLSAGVAKHFADGTPVTFVGDTYTPAELASHLARVVSMRAEVNAAKAALKAKLAVESTDMPSLRAVMGALASYVKAVYGDAPDVLADFGLHPKARTPLTVEAKAAAAAKCRATRAARHSMGTKQRKAIKGTVTGVTVTPVEVPQTFA